jgi:hypothetical protein
MEPEQTKMQYGIMDRAHEQIFLQPQKIGDFVWQGKGISAWKSGFCSWNKIWLEHEGGTFYSLERPKALGINNRALRSEYFGGDLVREYEGSQNCFIEFAEMVARLELFPDPEVFAVVGNKLMLEPHILALYSNFYIEFILTDD